MHFDRDGDQARDAVATAGSVSGALFSVTFS
jgi:hypothetical protein